MSNVKMVLEMWGNWARSNPGMDFSRVNVTFKSGLVESGRPLLCADDKQGMLVDSAVAKLRQYDELAYKLIISHYVFRISQSKLAKEIGKAQSYIATLIKVAEAFIAGQLAHHSS